MKASRISKLVFDYGKQRKAYIRAAFISLVARPSLRCVRSTANDVMCPWHSVDSSSLRRNKHFKQKRLRSFWDDVPLMILQLKDIHKTPEKEISTTRKISLTRIDQRNCIFTIKKTQNKPSREKNICNHNSLKGNMTMNGVIKPYENCTQSVRWHHHHLHRE